MAARARGAAGSAACVALRSHAHAAAYPDAGAGLSAHADGGAHDFVAERAGVGRWPLRMDESASGAPKKAAVGGWKGGRG